MSDDAQRTDPGLVEHERAGAQARARGAGQFENPHYRSAAMPGATGEPFRSWHAKAEAWRRGWTVENAIRGR